MRLLLLILVLYLTNAQREHEIVYLGRGYDVVKGNPLILRPNDGVAKGHLIDPGIKSTMVFKIGGGTQNAGIKGSANQQCKKKSISSLSILNFHDGLLKEMFPNSEEWHENLREFAVYGDYRSDNGKYPDDKMFFYLYEKCDSSNAENEQYISKKLTTSEANNYGEYSIEGVSDDFQRMVCQLPDEYTRRNVKYYQLLARFGTSIVIGTKLGKLKISRYQASKKKIRIVTPAFRHDQTTRTDQMYVHITEELQNKINNSIIEDKNSDKIHWEIGNTNHLSPVELSLWNLDEALHDIYWPNCYIFAPRPDINSPVDDDCCSRLPMLKRSVEQALLDYPEQLNVHLPKDTDEVHHVVWPSGTYSLFQTGSGCPAGTGFNWREGFVQHGQESGSKVTAPTGIFHADVLQKRTRVEYRYVMTLIQGPARFKLFFNYWLFTQRFCTKVNHGTVDKESTWPAGSYCVYKFGKCPQGFQEGWVYWDDGDGYNVNKHHGVYPNGVYDSNTKIYFCCRNDGPASRPIVLPVQKQFILMRLGGTCQTVKWTKVTEASIYFDGAWGSSWFPRNTFAGGLHPDNEIDYSNNKLYYCHYQKNISPK